MPIIDKSLIQRILVIKLRAIGDVVLSTVVLKNLRLAFPSAKIDFLTEKPSRDVLEGNPDINGVVAFNSKEQSGLSLIMKMRNKRYDLVIDLFGNPRSALVTFFSGARYRVGYKFGWREYCYTIRIDPRGGELHNTEFNLDALSALDIPIVSREPFFPCPDEAKQFAADFFKKEELDGKFVVALNPGGGWITKRWRPKQFAALGDLLRATFGAVVLIIWGPGEENLAEAIRSGMKSPSLLIPRTSLKQLAAILQRCSLMVTNDSGPMHIAAAMGTPIVAIYGPTRPQLQGPVTKQSEIVQNKKLLCLGCNYTKCPIENPCMEELSVKVVEHSVRKLVERLKQANAVPVSA